MLAESGTASLLISGGVSPFRKSVVTSVDGLPLDVFEGGDAGKPPVVLVNAYAMPVAFWAPLARELARDHHVLTWESRGVPNLDHAFDERRCGVADHSADLGAILEARNLARVKVVAWCSGGQVTLRFANTNPDRVEAAVLLSAGFRPLKRVPLSEFQSAMNVLFRQCAPSRARAQVYCSMLFGGQQPAHGTNAARGDGKAVFGDAWAALPEEILRMTSSPFQNPESLYRYANTVLAVEKEPEHAWTQGLRLPTLLLGGEKDSVVHPETWPAVARLLDGARVIVKPGGDHFMLYQDQSVAGVIRGFFRETDARLGRGASA
jgi:pimeloyl-ACP methyl ester carboxylesterase